MTRSGELVQDLRSALPSIKAALKTGNLAQRFDAKLEALSASLQNLRAVSSDKHKNSIEVRNAMSMASSNLREAKQVYLLLQQQIHSSPTLPRQDVKTAFETFDQKANELFSILSVVVKNEKELQSSITRNIV